MKDPKQDPNSPLDTSNDTSPSPVQHEDDTFTKTGMTRKGTVYKKVITNLKKNEEDQVIYGNNYFAPLADDEDDKEVSDNEGNIHHDMNVLKHIDSLSTIEVSFFVSSKIVLVFPLLAYNLIDRRSGNFIPLKKISSTIATLIDGDLHRRGKNKILTNNIHYGYGYEIDLRVKAYDTKFGEEFHLAEFNYQDILLSTYVNLKTIDIHVHHDSMTSNDFLDKNVDNIKEPGSISKLEPTCTTIKSEPATFRGHPIILESMYQSKRSPAPLCSHTHEHKINERGETIKTPCASRLCTPCLDQSPIQVYDDHDFLVTNLKSIIPFGNQSVHNRVIELQNAAMVKLPEVSSLPKMLKSHNVSFKENSNVSTWYYNFNKFCLTYGIYLSPPNAMDKLSEMGLEWDSGARPQVFYSRKDKMEKVLSQILLSHDFFPSVYHDELQLNPEPYNFIRMFMANHSNSVPNLSDGIIRHPGPMKNSQILVQYALCWVNYFNDEYNVNGIRYSKYRQNCYFIDVISSRFHTIKKFLELEFSQEHDKMDNIPISLDLHFIPTTIKNLCHTHGISLSAPHIQLVHDDDQYMNEAIEHPHIRKIVANPGNNCKVFPSKNNANVQCWLCDGNHTFHDCTSLRHMKTICSERPQVLCHFQQLLLKRDGPAIKIHLDAPEFFDDTLSGPNVQESNDDTEQSLTDHHSTTSSAITVEHINSLQIGENHSSSTCSFPFNSTLQVLALHDSSSVQKEHCNSINTVIRSVTDPYFMSSDMIIDNFCCAQVDGGANKCTTPYRHLVHFLQEPDITRGESLYISDAGGHRHTIEGMGYLHFIAETVDNQTIALYIPCMHIPSIPSTLIHFRLMKNLISYSESVNVKNNTASATIIISRYHIHPDAQHKQLKIVVPLILSKSCLYFKSLISKDKIGNEHNIQMLVPGNTRCNEYSITSSMWSSIQIVSDEATRILWHARMGHLNFRMLAGLHSCASGIPKIN